MAYDLGLLDKLEQKFERVGNSLWIRTRNKITNELLHEFEFTNAPVAPTPREVDEVAATIRSMFALGIPSASAGGLTPDGQPVGSGFTLNPVTGLAETAVDGDVFVALPTNPAGQAVGEIGHRRNTLANLLTLAGVAGEISVPTDADGVVIHNGVAGQAQRLFSPMSANSLGANSMAFGAGSSTTSTAASSLAMGPNAQAKAAGEFRRQGHIAGVLDVEYQLGRRTTSATPGFLTVDGAPETASNTLSTAVVDAGIWDVDVVILARQIGTNNWARFVRRATILRETGSTTVTLSNLTTTTPDVNSGLSGLAVTVMSSLGLFLGVMVTGLASTTIQWTGHVVARGNAITA